MALVTAAYISILFPQQLLRSSEGPLRKAINDTLNVDNVRTGDLGGKAGTKKFTAALLKRIQSA